jgi:hypothetical protein
LKKKTAALTAAEVELEIVQEIVYEIVELINVAVSDCHGLSVGAGNIIVLFSAILNVRTH